MIRVSLSRSDVFTGLITPKSIVVNIPVALPSFPRNFMFTDGGGDAQDRHLLVDKKIGA